MEKTDKKKREERLVIGVSLLIFVLAVALTLFISGLASSSGDDGGGGYNNITFTDAVLTCRKKTQSKHQKELIRLTLDDHSSRFEHAGNLYKIFYNVRIKDKDSESGVGDLYVNCYVDGARGSVASYETNEKKESRIEAIRKDDGGLFGWPHG